MRVYPSALFDSNSLLSYLVGTIEELLSDPGLVRTRAKNQNHPAVRLHDLLLVNLQVGFESVSGVSFDEMTVGMMRFLTDLREWHDEANESEMWSFLRNGQLRKEAKSRITDGDLFDDVMFELFSLGFLSQIFGQVELVSGDGKPDIKYVATDGSEVYVECKNFHLGTSRQRVQDILKKANRQIKRVSPDQSGLVMVRLNRDWRSSYSGEISPNDVVRFKTEIESALSRGFLRSISGVVLVWDQPLVIDQPGKRMTFVLKRVFKTISHPAPRSFVSLPAAVLNGGRTTMVRASGTGFGPYSQEGYVHESFDGRKIRIDASTLEAIETRSLIRGSHAVEAINEAHGMAEVSVDNRTFNVFAKSQKVFYRPHTLVVIVDHQLSEELVVVEAFRILHTSIYDDILDRNPDLALLEFGRRHFISLLYSRDIYGRLIFPVGYQVNYSSYRRELDILYSNIVPVKR